MISRDVNRTVKSQHIGFAVRWSLAFDLIAKTSTDGRQSWADGCGSSADGRDVHLSDPKTHLKVHLSGRQTSSEPSESSADGRNVELTMPNAYSTIPIKC